MCFIYHGHSIGLPLYGKTCILKYLHGYCSYDYEEDNKNIYILVFKFWLPNCLSSVITLASFCTEICVVPLFVLFVCFAPLFLPLN